MCGVLIGVSVLVLGAYWSNQVLSSQQIEEVETKALELRASALSGAVAEQTRSVIYNLDLALVHLTHRFADAGGLAARDVEEMRASTPPGLVRRVTVIDAAGRVNMTIPEGGEGIGLQDRPHFAEHVTGRSAGLFIGWPIKSRIEDEWVIPVSRRLSDRQGRFAGVIAIMVRPEYFAGIYARLGLGRDDVVALVRRDGAFLSRSAGLYEHLGKSVRDDRPFVGEKAPVAGSFRSISTHEPVDRVFAFRVLNEWPLVSVIGLDLNAHLQPIREERWPGRLAAFAVSALVVLLVAGICIVVRRLEGSLVRVSESDRRRAMAFAGASELAWEWDVHGRRFRFFGDCKAFFGSGGDEEVMWLSDWLPRIHPEDSEHLFKVTRDYVTGRTPTLECRYRLRFANGDYRWVLVRGQTVEVAADGRIKRSLGVLIDIDADRKAEIAAAQTKAAYQRLIESAGEGIVVVDREGMITLFNPAAERVLGWRSEEAVGQQIHALLHSTRDGSELIPEAECPVMRTVRDGMPRRELRTSYCHRDGRRIPVEVSVSPIIVDQSREGAVALISDVSRQIAYETELQRLARTDGLTGLWNRRYFVELFERELSRAEREGSDLSLLMLDIDHFKSVNDEYGHAAGDAVLIGMAAHLGAQLRQVDIVGRLGGEEFGIGLPGISLEEAALVADRLRREIENLDFEIGEELVRCSVSMGVVVWSCRESFDTVLARADAALYEAKTGGRNRVVVRPSPAQVESGLPGSAG
jgi:diguanylate cyclase (GGDEF)-like protein/PAS domain S-box-containing protein